MTSYPPSSPLHAPTGTRWLGRSWAFFTKTQSTNDDARIAATAGAPHGHVIVADAQTGGRGTRGRYWSSPPGVDLYLSILLRPPTPCPSPASLSVRSAFAALQAVRSMLPAVDPLRIKWPNDLYLQGKKCAGILTEASVVGERVHTVIVGVGLNVNRTRFEPPLHLTATSLRAHAGHPFSRQAVLEELLVQLERAVDRWARNRPFAAEAWPWFLHRGHRVTVDGTTGIAHGLNPDGSLVIARGDRRVVVRHGPLQEASADDTP